MSAATSQVLPSRRIAVFVGLWAVLPLLSVTYQLSAKSVAEHLATEPFGMAWLAHAFASPYAYSLIAAELASFAIWMGALSELKLSAAFVLSALSYVLILAGGVVVFGETVDTLQIVGSATILAGIALMAGGEVGNGETPPAAIGERR